MPTLDIMNSLDITGVTFMPQWRQELSRQAGGTPRGADLGRRLWMAKVACGEMTNDQAKQAAALIDDLEGVIGSFYVYDPRAQYPQADPDGSILGANVVTISDLGGDNKSIGLDGLPAFYKITPGDMLCWDHGTDPVVRCLHKFSEAGVADGAGVLGLTRISPHLRIGASYGLVVTLIRPAAEMFVLPGSYDFPSTGANTSSLSFTAIQV